MFGFCFCCFACRVCQSFFNGLALLWPKHHTLLPHTAHTSASSCKQHNIHIYFCSYLETFYCCFFLYFFFLNSIWESRFCVLCDVFTVLNIYFFFCVFFFWILFSNSNWSQSRDFNTSNKLNINFTENTECNINKYKLFITRRTSSHTSFINGNGSH